MGIPVQWRPVVDYEGLYEVNQFGDVRSLFRYKKVLKWNISREGYASVQLFKNGIGKRISVHRIVAFAFIPNPDSLPQVNHKDENKLNNCAENLEWCSAEYNMNYGIGGQTRHAKINYFSSPRKEHAKKNAMTMKKPVSQYTLDGRLIASFSSGKEASIKTGANHSHIMECCAGKRYKTVGGYIWKYATEGSNV